MNEKKHNKLDLKVGICGGGQLGRMLLEAASPLGLEVSVLDKSISFPAGANTSLFVEGDFTKYEDVVAFGEDLDLITIEIESVNIDALRYLEKLGKKVYPPTASLAIIKDKGLQKKFYSEYGLPTSPYKLYDDDTKIVDAIKSGTLTFPFVQKLRTDGYDGRGVLVVKDASQIEQLLQGPSLVEALVDIDTEIAVIVARSASGDTKAFPVTEQEFHPTANLVEFLFSPSRLSQEVQQAAIDLAVECASKMEVVGLLAIEMFLDKEGHIMINEVAPRPHNSGHHFTEGSQNSQFSQMWRALLDLPLGSTDMIRPAVMVNLLGDPGHEGIPYYDGLEDILNMEGVYPHIYGKKKTKPYRKMGHITVTANDLDAAISKARKVKETIRVIT